jgi:hypothetical protein
LARRNIAITIVTRSTYPNTLCVTSTQGRDASAPRTVYNTTLRQRRQGVSVTSNLFLRGQPNRKLRDKQLGPFLVEDQIGKHIYKLKLPSTVRLHPLFHVNNLRPSFTAPLRQDVPVTVHEGDDEEFHVSHDISIVCIKSLPGRRCKYLLFMTHFIDDDIPHVWHRLNEVHRTMALQEFLETPQWDKFAKTQAYNDFMHAHPSRILESQKLLQ